MAKPAKSPALSVVIPYYRGHEVIREAVQSVLDQTLRPQEIVICDDGSPDDLDGALGSLRAHVKVVRKQNGGIASAMNAATDAASGEFLVQLDQDDAFLPRRIEAIADVITANPHADIVATDAIVEYAGARVVTLGEVHPFQTADQRTGIVRACFFLWPAIRRSRLIAVGGYDESFPVMQDWECFIRLVLDGATVAYVDEPLYRWRLTPGSRSSLDGMANAKAIVRMMTKTLANSNLTASERVAAESALATHRARMTRERARHAIDSGAADARRRSLELIVVRGCTLSTRVKAGVAFLSPNLANRFFEHRRQQNPGVEALARRGFRRPG
jgi:hypothetical protein